MTNYREILRLYSMGISKAQIADACCCARGTVQRALRRAEMQKLSYPLPEGLTDRDLSDLLFPPGAEQITYKMPDYEHVHREMAKSGVTLNLLWLEYCEHCRMMNSATSSPHQPSRRM